MTNLEQAIIKKIHQFPPEKQQKVLDYAESLDSIDAPLSGRQTLWDSIEDIIRDVPEDAWDDVPTDGSLNVDHYLYGAPKRTR